MEDRTEQVVLLQCLLLKGPFLTSQVVLLKGPLLNGRCTAIPASMAQEPLLHALDDLIAAIEHNTARNRLLLQRARDIKRERAKGTAWRDIVSEEQRPLIVELLTQNLEALSTAGGQLRRMEARALHEEGL